MEPVTAIGLQIGLSFLGFSGVASCCAEAGAIVSVSRVNAEVSVSLGLIVTELVIDALKHAFPQGRQGRIVVDYDSHGPGRTLSVADNGVGMPKQPTRTAA